MVKDVIKLESVSKAFGKKTVLQGLNLDVKQNETLALLGPNGCGKTTLLNIISGLSKPDDGRVILNGVLVGGKRDGKTVHVLPCDRKVGYVFQASALFPHMRVRDNVAFGLRAKNYSKQEIASRTQSLLEFVNMTEYSEYYPHQISGGQKQLVALARSLAADPQVLLLDEPMSAVDIRMRESLRVEFKKILQNLSITAIYVTHNLNEAITLSDRIAIIGNGQIEQVGTRADILINPKSKFVAEFLGLNVYDAKVIANSNNQPLLEICGVPISGNFHRDLNKKSLLVTLKPEDVVLLSAIDSKKLAKNNECSNFLKGTVIDIQIMRSTVRVSVDVGFIIKSELTLAYFNDLNLLEGREVYVFFKNKALNISD